MNSEKLIVTDPFGIVHLRIEKAIREGLILLKTKWNSLSICVLKQNKFMGSLCM